MADSSKIVLKSGTSWTEPQTVYLLTNHHRMTVRQLSENMEESFGVSRTPEAIRLKLKCLGLQDSYLRVVPKAKSLKPISLNTSKRIKPVLLEVSDSSSYSEEQYREREEVATVGNTSLDSGLKIRQDVDSLIELVVNLGARVDELTGDVHTLTEENKRLRNQLATLRKNRVKENRVLSNLFGWLKWSRKGE